MALPPRDTYLLAVGTPQLHEGAAVMWTVGRPMGQPWRLFRHKVFSMPLQPSVALVLDTESQASPWPVGPWAPQLAPSSRHPYLPPEAAQGPWCPLLCCPPRGPGKEQPSPAFPHGPVTPQTGARGPGLRPCCRPCLLWEPWYPHL